MLRELMLKSVSNFSPRTNGVNVDVPISAGHCLCGAFKQGSTKVFLGRFSAFLTWSDF